MNIGYLLSGSLFAGIFMSLGIPGACVKAQNPKSECCRESRLSTPTRKSEQLSRKTNHK